MMVTFGLVYNMKIVHVIKQSKIKKCGKDVKIRRREPYNSKPIQLIYWQIHLVCFWGNLKRCDSQIELIRWCATSSLKLIPTYLYKLRPCNIPEDSDDYVLVWARLFIVCFNKERNRELQTDRQRNRQKGRAIDSKAGREIDRQTERQTGEETERRGRWFIHIWKPLCYLYNSSVLSWYFII